MITPIIEDKIDVAAPSIAARKGDGGAFAAAMADAYGGTDKTPEDSKTSVEQRGIAKLGDAITAFRKEASLTPAQRARRDVLKAMDLSEDGIKAMKPKEREEVEKKIAIEVARRLRMEEARKSASAFGPPPPAFATNI